MNVDDLKESIIYNKDSLDKILGYIKNVRELDAKLLKSDETVLVIVDMINGFTKEGNLKSERIENIIPNVVKSVEICQSREFKMLAFADAHTVDSKELKDYPIHCLKKSSESDLISELRDFNGIKVINKNSTNGYMEKEFRDWIKENNSVKNFVVIGNCTDVCIMQFVLSLKSYFNKNNQESNIIIPIDSVETFNSEDHNGDIMNLFAIYNMKLNGIKIVSNIK